LKVPAVLTAGNAADLHEAPAVQTAGVADFFADDPDFQRQVEQYRARVQAAGREGNARYQAVYRARHPGRILARRAVRLALAHGVLKLGPCAWIGKPGHVCAGDVEAHHSSYAEADWLNVQSLCRRAHLAADREQRKVQRKSKKAPALLPLLEWP